MTVSLMFLWLHLISIKTVVNAKDYVMLRDVTDPQLSALYNEIFMNFYNESEDTFTYQNQS